MHVLFLQILLHTCAPEWLFHDCFFLNLDTRPCDHSHPSQGTHAYLVPTSNVWHQRHPGENGENQHCSSPPLKTNETLLGWAKAASEHGGHHNWNVAWRAKRESQRKAQHGMTSKESAIVHNKIGYCPPLSRLCRVQMIILRCKLARSQPEK